MGKKKGKQPYRKAPGLVPKGLLDKKAECPDCNTTFDIPWLEELDHPLQPIAVRNEGHFVPVSFPLRCPNFDCNNSFNYTIPNLENLSPWALYGDEASRDIQNPKANYTTKRLHFFCITLVGLHKDRAEKFLSDFEDLKREARPDVDPKEWAHHFTKIWSAGADDKEYSFSSKAQKIDYAKKIASLIRKNRYHIVTLNFSSCIVLPENEKERKKLIRRQKQEIFQQSIISSVLQFRLRQVSTYWIFDNVKDTSSGEKTEGWAEECFLGLQYTRLFAWLTAGATATKPTFVRPGSHHLLEVADFVSYCVARDFERTATGHKPEFPSKLMGNGFYQGAWNFGHSWYGWSKGLPMMKYYNLS
ncbi:hypothetical protein FM042_03430 [Aliidiomarina halalkaliphila]|uniref:DUF3800 domain-containing protein n=1 Tax=Aliidiomarina halalkaliphila TaxID=2593535 RepID=A0A552X4F4_9GAMM|nr:hypothetical protein [Aliidiomarina halalkaliphila]TRW49914.1 hypothetical protein FM042_03430 [Aliidiomarina halalkaliphila]